MISSKQAEAMGYLDYKVEMWKRLLQFWLERDGETEAVRRRIEVCRVQHEYWKERSGNAV